MEHPQTTVWLHPAEAGCGHCLPGPEGAACGATRGVACEQPQLSGDPAVLSSVLQALRGVADAEGNLVDGRRFSALRVTADEVELTLAFPRACGPARLLAEDAFAVLRRTLPDTDIYVLHPR
jgi:hypothetical protein